MAGPNDDIIAVLNDLIETCEDGANGFSTAAEAITDPEAKLLLQSRLAQILNAESQLRAAVRELGGAPVDHGHASASLHRGWINLKSVVARGNDETILDEVVRGEETAARWYRDALKRALPPTIKLLVGAQARGVEENLERVKWRRSMLSARAPSHRPSPESRPSP